MKGICQWPVHSGCHYYDVIMGAIASQITSLTIVFSTVYLIADQRKHQSSATLAFVGEFTGTGEFPAQRASNAENVSIWWRHHEFRRLSREITISLHNVIWRRARRTPCQMFGSMKNDFWKAVYYQGHFLWIWGPMDSRMDPIVSGSE